MACAASAAYLMSRKPCMKSVAAHATMMNHATTSVKMQPDDHVEPRGLESVTRDALFHNRRLQVELHPRGDGRSDNADHHEDIGLIAKRFQVRRLEGGDDRVFPGGLRQNARKNVRHIEDRRDQEHFLDSLVMPFHHHQPDHAQRRRARCKNCVT